MQSQSVLEELTDDGLTREHVQQRVDDWAQRITGLYRNVEAWLPAGWTARPGQPVTMQERLMQRFGISSRQLPTLELIRVGAIRARMRPNALWIIGTNGRVDLMMGQELFFILDTAKTFEAPSWQISSAAARSTPIAFDEARFKVLLTA